jgi:hypothetical protein
MNPIVPAVIIGGVAYELVKHSSPPTPTLPTTSYAPGWDPGQMNQAGFYTPVNDPNVQAKIDLLKASAEQSFNRMDASARLAAAQNMNSALGTNLSGNESWQSVVAAASGAAGAAACSAIPGVGALASPLCAIGASYLGVKLEDWIGQGLGDLKSFVVDNVFGGVSDAAQAVIGAIGDAASNVASTVGGWLDNIF